MVKTFIITGLATSIVVSLLFTVLLVGKALMDFTRAGPQVKNEISHHYRLYAVVALLRLSFWAFTIILYLALIGASAYSHILVIADSDSSWYWLSAANVIGIATISITQFYRHLLYMPSSITASFQLKLFIHNFLSLF